MGVVREHPSPQAVPSLSSTPGLADRGCRVTHTGSSRGQVWNQQADQDAARHENNLSEPEKISAGAGGDFEVPASAVG